MPNMLIVYGGAILIAAGFSGFLYFKGRTAKAKQTRGRKDRLVSFVSSIFKGRRPKINEPTKATVIAAEAKTIEEPEQKQPATIEKYSKEGVINAEIFDPVHRKRGFYHVELIHGKDYGRVSFTAQKSVFSLQIKEDGSLEPISHASTMLHPPSEVFRAIHTGEKVREVFGNHDNSGDKLKLGLLVFAACVALFLMFMAVYRGSQDKNSSPPPAKQSTTEIRIG